MVGPRFPLCHERCLSDLVTPPLVILTGHTSFASKTLFYRAVEILKINKERIESGLGAINAVRGHGEES